MNYTRAYERKNRFVPKQHVTCAKIPPQRMRAKKSKQQIDRELNAWLQRSPGSSRIVESPLYAAQPTGPKKTKAKTTPRKKTKAAPRKKTKAAPRKKTKAAPRKKTKAAPHKKAKTTPRKKTKAAPRKKAKATPRKIPTRVKAAPRLQPARNVLLDVQSLRLDPVLEAVTDMPISGRYGDKVYISEIWRRVGHQVAPTLPDFKRWLLEQNRLGKLVLARGDLMGAMDPRKIAESEIQDRGATFHFVLDPAFSW